MASHLVSEDGMRKREREKFCSLSNHQSYGYQRLERHSAIQPEDNSKEHNIGSEKSANKRRGRQQAQMLHTFGFSYLASSFLYIVTKVKAFYNGFLGDAASESIEAQMTETYFSLPVIPN
ncbi:hypothetical protein TanjilG_27685 [Lupinus angustifolius]|uniref:Uncharacterized protein n=1 Tax=Lupinus angustifolius TaxID=3871 RepID=A0A4P1RH61_LUPAN|nr:PREDICTED: uncharacterized protein LOC109349032 [Lupinus angustifolius]OIW10739.1 hypothetical protein TanjilG_27685 [Lupinus angustifolius]